MIVFSARSAGSQSQLLPQLSLDFWDLLILAITPVAAGLAARWAARGTVTHSLRATL
jgi:cell division transport system permease protein